MKKILYVNSFCGYGSTGRIVTELANRAKSEGYTVKIVCASIQPYSNVNPDEVIVTGSKLDYYIHNALSRITDHEGLYSKSATKRLIQNIQNFDPDIVHVHNLHGHWINYELLFMFLAQSNKKIIWTLHDCWPFTGHCSYFSIPNCNQWKNLCFNCPWLKSYPKCVGRGDVANNYKRKRKAFTSVDNMTIVTPSNWLKNLVCESFLGRYRVEVIHNKIDLSVFKPTVSGFRSKYSLQNKKVILGVANVWSYEKGYEDFLKLRKMLDDQYGFVMVGLSEDQISSLPKGIIGIARTRDVNQLAEIYTAADVFVNLTYQDNFPTVNLEAIACGTPVISYETGGSCETFDNNSGLSVQQGNLNAIVAAVKTAENFIQCDVLQRRKHFEGYGDYSSLYREVSMDV